MWIGSDMLRSPSPDHWIGHTPHVMPSVQVGWISWAASSQASSMSCVSKWLDVAGSGKGHGMLSKDSSRTNGKGMAAAPAVGQNPGKVDLPGSPFSLFVVNWSIPGF